MNSENEQKYFHFVIHPGEIPEYRYIILCSDFVNTYAIIHSKLYIFNILFLIIMQK